MYLDRNGCNVMKTESVSHQRPIRLWRNRNFLLLWSGQMVSQTGTGISQLAFPLLMLALTHSPAQAGFVGALRGLSFIVLSLPAGALVDRWNRKRVMIVCDIGRGLVMASIPIAFLSGHLTVVQLYVATLLEGTLFTFFTMAETALLPHIVAREQIGAAVSQNEATYSFTLLVGPLLGGILYGIAKLLPFLADAITYGISATSLALIRTYIQKDGQEKREQLASTNLWAEIGEGLRWLWLQPLIRFLALLTGYVNMILISGELVVIVIAQQQHATPAFIGVIFAIGGIGSAVGAALSAPVQKILRVGQIAIITIWLITLFWSLFTVALNPLLLAIIFACFTLVGPVYNVMQYSYRVTMIPDELQGRVNSGYRLVSMGLQPLGLALTGVLLQRFGPLITLLVFSIGLVVLAVVTTINPHIRQTAPYL